MNPTARPLLVALVGAAALLVPLGPGAEPAGAWTEGPCPSASGVTVVVDFQQLGGGVWIRCAPGSPATGLQALADAGIDWTPTVRFADFVCRIAGQPAPEVDLCVNTPPATRYWSYWTAPRGGTWTYSNQGGRRTPIPGTVEGWSFSQTGNGEPSPPPRVAPPAPPAPPSTTPTTPRPATLGTPPATRPSGAGAATHGLPATGPSSPRAVTPAASAGAPTTTAGPAAQGVPPDAGPSTTVPADDGSTDGSADGSTVDPAPLSSRSRGTIVGADGEEIALNAPGRRPAVDTGSPTGTIAAIAIVAALAVTSSAVRRRRDSRTADPAHTAG